MRKFLLLFLLTVFPAVLQAQSLLLVNTFDSWEKSYSFPLSDVTSLSFVDGKLNVELASADASQIPLAAIAEIKFNGQSGIKSVNATSAPALVYDRDAQSLLISGLSAESPLCVYGMDGRIYVSVPAYSGTSIDVSRLTGGVYIVIAGNYSFKFAK